jgi:transposase
MGKKNKTVKLTPRKIRYIIRYKTNNYSTKSIAKDLKISESTVKRVWMHWIKTKTPLNISKFGRKNKELDEASEDLILKINK